MQVVVKLRKDESLCEKGPSVEQEMFGKKDMLRQRYKGRCALIDTVLDVCVSLKRRGSIVT